MNEGRTGWMRKIYFRRNKKTKKKKDEKDKKKYTEFKGSLLRELRVVVKMADVRKLCLGPRRSWFICHLNMPFLYEKSISVSDCNNKMNRRFFSKQAIRGLFNAFFCSVNIEKSERMESWNNRKAGTTGKPERPESRNDRKAGTNRKFRRPGKPERLGNPEGP